MSRGGPARAAAPENGRVARATSIRSVAMQGLLAAALALALAGCSFHAPDASSPGGADDDAAASMTDAAVDAPPAARCTTYGTSYNGHKYRMVESGMPWAQARANCEADGGYLLKIETQPEDFQVETAFVAGPQEVWTGLRDVDQSGVYVWTDGTLPSFTHWSGSAPGAGSPDCVAKNTYVTDGHWYTRDCTDSRDFICECNP
jgi:hypothetical protein